MTDPVKTALLTDIQQSLLKIIDEAREIVATYLNDEGDKCADCQRICLELSINELEATINGISVSDLK